MSNPLRGESGPTGAGWHRIADYLQCPKKYQYGQVRGLRVPQTKTPDHFVIGSGLHAGRAAWLWGDTPEQIKAAVLAELAKQELPVSVEAERRTLLLVEQYIDHWRLRPKPQVLATEYVVGPAPVHPDHATDQSLWRTAKLDDVSRYPEAGGKLAIGEVKTTSASVFDCVNEYTLHGQTMLQMLLWKLSPQGEAAHGPVSGVVLDVVKKGYGENKPGFARQFMPFTSRMLEWFANTMDLAVRGAQQVKWDTDAPRVGYCTRLVGRGRVACEYRELCMHGRAATMGFVLANGRALNTWAPDANQTVPPWE